VTYDLSPDQAIRVIKVAGTLTFPTDRNTPLDVGLIRIHPGDDTSENGFDCDAHFAQIEPSVAGSSLLVATPDRPIGPDVVAKIRLVPFGGMDRDTCPAIVCCGGRMEFHGAPMSRTWVKLGRTLKKGDTAAPLAEPVTGWRVGNRVILTATARDGREQGTLRPRVKGRRSFTEERTITAIDGLSLTLDQPLFSLHYGILLPGYDPRIRPYGQATFKSIRQTGVLPASPTALPGEKAPLPTGVDDRPPATVTTCVMTNREGRLVIRGTTADNGEVRRVLVNGIGARRVAQTSSRGSRPGRSAPGFDDREGIRGRLRGQHRAASPFGPRAE